MRLFILVLYNCVLLDERVPPGLNAQFMV